MTDPAANVGAVATALTSSAFRHALRIYNAAVDDLETSATDIAFLRSVYETERQADLIEQILIAQTPPPMPPLRPVPWCCFHGLFGPVRIDPYILMVFAMLK